MDANLTVEPFTPLIKIKDYHWNYYFQQYYYYDNFIILAFLLAGVCVGLFSLIWALYVLYGHHNYRGHISAFVIFLLLNDLLELMLTVFIVSYVFFNSIGWYDYIGHRGYEGWYGNKVHYLCEAIWATCRIGGIYLHQMVALQSILSLKNQACSAHLFTRPCSITLCIVLWLTVFGCQLLDHRLFNIVLCLLPFSIVAVMCTLTCKAPPNPPDPVPHTGPKPGSAVLVVATLTLLAFSAPPVIVLVITNGNKPSIGIHDTLSAFLVSLRVISDPLLCVLVCKEKLRVQTQFSIDRQSV